MQLCDVAHMNHIGETQLCHLNGKGFDLACPHRDNAVVNGGQWESPYPIKQAAHRQSFHLATA